MLRNERIKLQRIQVARRRIRRNLNIARLYLRSLHQYRKSKEIFAALDTFCLFIGYPRSGHSLVGSLVDAHPNAVIAHELDALSFIQIGCNKNHLYHLLLENSQAFASAGRAWTGYSYRVPGQWQGRFQKLRVIGDKKGSGTTAKLRNNPDLLLHLRQTIDIPLKFVHVVRNPYDNISTMSMRQTAGFNLEWAANRYFSLCATVAKLKKHVTDFDILDLRHETLISDPKPCLSQLCHFLGLNPSPLYLNDCRSILFQTPHQTRHDVHWPPELIDRVRGQMAQFDFLEGYSYEESSLADGRLL
jgi:hypothetical protein